MSSPMDEFQEKKMLALERRAIREGWPISNQMKRELVESAHDIATSEDKTPQNRLSAMRNMLTMEGQNIERERIDAQLAGPERNDGIVSVRYVDDWFYHPTEEQIRELENSKKGEDDGKPGEADTKAE